MVRSWLHHVDKLVPAVVSDEDREKARRTRLAVLLCLTVVTATTPLGVYRMVSGHLLVGAGLVTCCLVWMMALIVLRRTGSLVVFGHVVAGTWLSIVLAVLTELGSLAGHDAMVTGVASVFVTFFVGAAAGALWLGVEILGLLIVGMWVHAQFGEIANAVGFCILSYGLVAAFEWTRAAALRELKAAEASRRHTQEELSMLRADRMAVLGQLAAGVAHEVNNPLSYVLGNLTYLRDEMSDVEGLDPDWAEAINDAIDGAGRVKRIISELKTYSRVDEKVDAPVDMVEVLDVALRLGETELRHRCAVTRDLEPVPPVMGDESRLVQVFINLLVNAVHATEMQGGQLEVRTRHLGDTVEVSVRDDGCGIPKDALEHVFEPFFSTKPVGKGTGLGLSVSRNIIQSLGGQLRIESEPGRGTEVIVSLPTVAEASPCAVDSEAAPQDAVVRHRILVIDDDRLVLRAMKRRLHAHDVICAASGEVGLEILAHDDDWDLILCDIMMPNLTGPEFYRRLANRNASLAASVTFITGGAVTEETRVFIEHYADRVLSKPLGDEALERLLSETQPRARRRASDRSEMSGQWSSREETPPSAVAL